ncbi:MAG: type I-U CRISPR-associated protein Cas5/Cas6 [Verrucomicrobiae bacterium]|nr:type I-U CRISPR-associated protein Cas5/Cas6 [Verrucomicrobiae bacterium]
MSLTISLQFPAGRYVAAAWGDKDAVEWPPHPARLCLGLLDALHRVGEPCDMREALEWLSAQTPPLIVVPDEKGANLRVLDGIFVPQNPSAAEGVKPPRKQRSFPAIFLDPDNPTVFLHWPDVVLPAALDAPMQALFASLPRLGHSSSLVMAKVSSDGPPSGNGWRVIRPMSQEESGSPEFRLRVAWDGLLQSAEGAFDLEGRTAEMEVLVKAAARSAKPDKSLKPAASPRGRHDPRHRWHGYLEEMDAPPHASPWDERILVLSQVDGDRMGLQSVWQLTEAFHKALLDRWSRDPSRGPVPTWLSGHRSGVPGSDTAPTAENHLAVFPLPFGGGRHATGHLLGLGLAFPRPETAGVDSATLRFQWRQALSALLGESEEGMLELSPRDKAWSVRLRPDDSPHPKEALRPGRWTRPSTIWTSVTPVILDRHPKPHFKKDPAGWSKSCSRIVEEACRRIGLPRPEEIHVSPHSPLQGVPPAFSFAAPVARPGRPPRFHVHVSMRFSEEIQGPLLLGAGRFRGYGLFLPPTPKDLPSDE